MNKERCNENSLEKSLPRWWRRLKFFLDKPSILEWNWSLLVPDLGSSTLPQTWLMWFAHFATSEITLTRLL